jgi:hypothetical protein
VQRSDVVLGPLFTAGVVMVGLGVLRRSWGLVGLGAAAIVADQCLPAAWRLNEAIASRVTPQE